jgi:hypothetical protein
MGGGGPASFAAIGPCVSAVNEVERPAQRVAHMFDGPFKPCLEWTEFMGQANTRLNGGQQGPGLAKVAGAPCLPLASPSPPPVQCPIRWSLSHIGLLLRRTMTRHMLCSRSRKILNVFQRIRLRFFTTCGLASACPSLSSLRTLMSDRLLANPLAF